jgi:chromosome partitioning protein
VALASGKAPGPAEATADAERGAGVATLDGIARALTARGTPTPSGRGGMEPRHHYATGAPAGGHRDDLRMRKQSHRPTMVPPRRAPTELGRCRHRTRSVLLIHRIYTEKAWGRYGDDTGCWGIKGGIGKSTLAANLAVLTARAGRDVLLIDADPQETTKTWAAARANQLGELAPVTTVTIVGKQIREELRRLTTKYQTIIVDAGARDTTTQRAALSAANLVLLPFPPRGPDLWTLDAVAQTVTEVRTINDGLRAVAFVNRADPIGDDNAEAEAAFAEHAEAIEAAPIRVGNRKGIAVAHLMGLAAVGAKRPDAKAVAELDTLLRCAFDIVNAR